MSEPRFIERREGSARPPGGRAPAPEVGTGGIRRALRGTSFAEGEKMLSPRPAAAPVQRKPGPEGGARSEVAGPGEAERLREEDGALREENGALREENRTLKTALEVEAAKNEENERDGARSLERAIDGSLRLANLELGLAQQQLVSIESYVEELLVQDRARNALDQRLDVAVEAHRKSQMPGLLDVLVALTSAASMVKSIVETAQSALLKGGSGALGAKLVDTSRTTVGAADAAERVRGKQERAGVGDTVTSMVQALDGKLGGLRGEVEALRGFVFTQSFQSFGEKLSRAALQLRDTAQQSDRIKPSRDAAFVASVGIVLAELHERASDLLARANSCHALVAARTPAEGGSELAAGTVGRSVFDLVRGSPSEFTLIVATELHVEAAFGREVGARTVKSHYWLRASDERRRCELQATQRLPLTLPLVRPAEVAASDLPLSPERGRPLASVAGKMIELPYETVVVRGHAGERAVTRSEWEDPEQRERLLQDVTRAPLSRSTLP